MNYIQMKKRIFFTTQYPLLRFSSDIMILNELISILNALPALPIISFLGGALNISAPIKGIPTGRIQTEILFNLGIECMIDSSLMSELILPEAQEIAFNISAKPYLSSSRKIKSNMPINCSILSNVYIPPPLIEMLVFIQSVSYFNASSVLSECLIVPFIGFDFLSYFEASVQMSSAIIFDTVIPNNINWRITLAVLNYLALCGFVTGELTSEIILNILQRELLKCSVYNESYASTSLDMIRARQLKDIDNLPLSVLDNQTLLEIAYNF